MKPTGNVSFTAMINGTLQHKGEFIGLGVGKCMSYPRVCLHSLIMSLLHLVRSYFSTYKMNPISPLAPYLQHPKVAFSLRGWKSWNRLSSFLYFLFSSNSPFPKTHPSKRRSILSGRFPIKRTGGKMSLVLRPIIGVQVGVEIKGHLDCYAGSLS